MSVIGVHLFPVSTEEFMTDAKICSKCGNKSEDGFSPDYYAAGSSRQMIWVRGKPKKILFGLFGIAFERPIYPIVIYRCLKCGFLEAYAPTPADLD
jgi:hypothetical protein